MATVPAHRMISDERVFPLARVASATSTAATVVHAVRVGANSGGEMCCTGAASLVCLSVQQQLLLGWHMRKGTQLRQEDRVGA